MTSINLLCQHIKFVIWYRLVFSRFGAFHGHQIYNKSMMFPLPSYTYENYIFQVTSCSFIFPCILFHHAFRHINFPRCWFPPCLPSLSSPVRLPRISCAVHPGTRFQRLLSPVGSLPPALIPARFRFPQMETGDLDFPSPGQTPVGNASADTLKNFDASM